MPGGELVAHQIVKLEEPQADMQERDRHGVGDGCAKRSVAVAEAAQHQRMRPLLLQVLQGQLRFLGWARDAGGGVGDLGLS